MTKQLTKKLDKCIPAMRIIGKKRDDKYYQDLTKMVLDCDGAVMVLKKDNRLTIKYFNLNDEEIVHALEYCKLKVMLDD